MNIRSMQARLDQHEADLARRPLWLTGRDPYLKIQIDQGQTLESGDLGIKYSSTPITSFPSAYDPNTMTSFMDGVGRGILYVNGIARTGYVLVINDSQSTIASSVIQGDNCWPSRALSVDAGGGLRRFAYLIG